MLQLVTCVCARANMKEAIPHSHTHDTHLGHKLNTGRIVRGKPHTPACTPVPRMKEFISPTLQTSRRVATDLRALPLQCKKFSRSHFANCQNNQYGDVDEKKSKFAKIPMKISIAVLSMNSWDARSSNCVAALSAVNTFWLSQGEAGCRKICNLQMCRNRFEQRGFHTGKCASDKCWVEKHHPFFKMCHAPHWTTKKTSFLKTHFSFCIVSFFFVFHN